MASVSLVGLSKRFGPVVALAELSLDIADREFLVLLGPSGCGKTTTMRMIAGLDEPTSGDIFIDDKRVNDLRSRDRNLAMVFQNYALYPHMTVGDNIGYPLKVRKVAREERLRRIQEAAAKVELSDYLERRPAELSGGQRQRVALARSIVRTPKLFLMDEPLSNLDARLRTVMRGQLKHLQRALGTTTIYVTHDQVEAMTLADRICILNQGRIQQLGTPTEIYHAPANIFVAGFVGSPPMNLLAGNVSAGQFSHAAGNLSIGRADLPAGLLTLGQRPEDLALVGAQEGQLRGTIFFSELLGDCMLVSVNVGQDLVIVKAPPGSMPAEGAEVGVRFNPDKMHFFATADGGRR